MQPQEVLLYILLYKALFGLVIQPKPLGALNPMDCLINLFSEVRAAILLLIDGILNPNFIIHTLLTRFPETTVMVSIKCLIFYNDFKKSLFCSLCFQKIIINLHRLNHSNYSLEKSC